MKLKNILLSVLLVSMVILGCNAYITGLMHGYNETIDLSGFNETRSRLDEQTNLTTEIYNVTRNLKLDTPGDIITTPYQMIVAGWKSMLLMFNSFETFVVVTTESVDQLSVMGVYLPDWVIPGIISIITISLIIIAIELFFKWRLEEN